MKYYGQKYEFSTKLNSRKNSVGGTVEKVRVWLEESKNNRFLSDAGFVRGAAVDIVMGMTEVEPTVIAINKILKGTNVPLLGGK